MTEEANAEQSEEAPETLTGLGDVFNDEPEQKAEPEAKEVEKVESKDEEAETTAAEPGSQETAQIAALQAQINGLKSGIAAERKKRQEVEKQIPDPVEEPEAYSEHLKTEQSNSELNLRINLSRDVYADLKDDFVEKESVFLGMVVDNEGNVTDPLLLAKFQQSPNPAKFAYDTAAEKMLLEEVKAPNYREKLKEELTAEIKAELAKERKAVEVPDLTTTAAKGGNSEAEAAPVTLSNVFAS